MGVLWMSTLQEPEIRPRTVLMAINTIFERALTCETEEELGATCLDVAQELTQSAYGWIGEINDEGLLDTIALSNPGWGSCQMPKSDAAVLVKNMPLQGIWSAVLRDKKSEVVNSPATHPDSVGIPEGNPALNAFLGVPLKQAGETVGMISLANKPGGYDEADRETIEQIAPAILESILRKRAELGLKEERRLLQEKVAEVERFNRLAVGREERLIELKNEVNEICKSAGKEPRYRQYLDSSNVSGVPMSLPIGEPAPLETGEAAIGDLPLGELVDLKELEQLLVDFSKAIGIPSAIIDLEGNFLASSHLQRACTDFHRANSQSCKRCIESDTTLSMRMQEGEEFSIYQCKNGLVDAASPIVVNGQHLANLFIGQFLTQPPGLNYFRQQAARFGYDEDDYLAAIQELPIVPEEKLRHTLHFLVALANVLGNLAIERIASSRAANAAKERADELLKQRLAALNLAEDAEQAHAKIALHEEKLKELVEERTAELNNRAKELNCLYSITQLINNHDLSVDEIAHKTVKLVQGGCLNPEITCVSLQLEGKKYKTSNFKNTPWQQTSKIFLNRKMIGAIKVGLLKECPGCDNREVMEEKKLLDDIAHKFSLLIRQRGLLDQLKKSETRFRSYFEQGLIGMAVTSPEKGWVEINKRLCEMLGYAETELRQMTWAEITHPKDLESDSQQFKHLLDGEIDSYTLEKRFIHKSGSIVHTILSVRGYRREDGAIDHVFALVQDISDKKLAEDQLKISLDNLKRSNEELVQFAYVASHDLQEPLRKISSFTELFAKRYEDQVDEKGAKYIGYIVDGAQRMQTLISDLLSYSRVGTRGKPPEPVACKEVVEAALDNLSRSIEENGAVIECGDLPVITADASQLVQLFQNLIGNGIKFRGEQTPHIRIEAEENSDEWLFAVKDNGIGIEGDFFERIFIIFQRLHGKAEYPGTGIGLAICKKIVERHGGRIWIQSTPGRGSAFFFALPKRAGEANGNE